MSIHCTKRVWEHSNQDTSARLLLLAIADHADHDGFAFPGLQTLAAMIHRSTRQTMRLVARLQDAAELLVFQRTGRGNLYVVLPGATRDMLAAALDRATSFGATVPGGTLERILDRISGVQPQPVPTCQATPDASASTPDTTMSPPPDIGDPTPDTSLSPPPDNLSLTSDKPMSSPPDTGDPAPDMAMSPTPDKPMSPDPSLTIKDPSGRVIDPSGQDLWRKILDALQCQMDPATFDHCLRGSRAIRVDGERLIVQLRYGRALPWLENRLASVIARTLAYYLPGMEVRFLAPGTVTAGPVPNPHAPQDAHPAGEPASHPNTQANPVSTPTPPQPPDLSRGMSRTQERPVLNAVRACPERSEGMSRTQGRPVLNAVKEPLPPPSHDCFQKNSLPKQVPVPGHGSPSPPSRSTDRPG